MPGEPLVFVEVALMRHVPGRIGEILSSDRARIEAVEADTAVFYSISNCQLGLRGISFGNFLIKQVVIELRREFPALERFVTLSPLPGLRRWTERSDLPDAVRDLIPPPGEAPAHPARLAAHYLLTARRDSGAAFDPVAHFHLGNGAQLFDIHPDADQGVSGQSASWGIMVNYLYDEAQVDARHRAYTGEHTIAAASKVTALLPSPRRRKRTDA
jgi:malonyl-CoA decarboxylase